MAKIYGWKDTVLEGDGSINVKKSDKAQQMQSAVLKVLDEPAARPATQPAGQPVLAPVAEPRPFIPDVPPGMVGSPGMYTTPEEHRRMFPPDIPAGDSEYSRWQHMERVNQERANEEMRRGATHGVTQQPGQTSGQRQTTGQRPPTTLWAGGQPSQAQAQPAPAQQLPTKGTVTAWQNGKPYTWTGGAGGDIRNPTPESEARHEILQRERIYNRPLPPPKDVYEKYSDQILKEVEAGTRSPDDPIARRARELRPTPEDRLQNTLQPAMPGGAVQTEQGTLPADFVLRQTQRQAAQRRANETGKPQWMPAAGGQGPWGTGNEIGQWVSPLKPVMRGDELPRSVMEQLQQQLQPHPATGLSGGGPQGSGISKQAFETYRETRDIGKTAEQIRRDQAPMQTTPGYRMDALKELQQRRLDRATGKRKAGQPATLEGVQQAAYKGLLDQIKKNPDAKTLLPIITEAMRQAGKQGKRTPADLQGLTPDEIRSRSLIKAGMEPSASARMIRADKSRAALAEYEAQRETYGKAQEEYENVSAELADIDKRISELGFFADDDKLKAQRTEVARRFNAAEAKVQVLDEVRAKKPLMTDSARKRHEDIIAKADSAGVKAVTAAPPDAATMAKFLRQANFDVELAKKLYLESLK